MFQLPRVHFSPLCGSVWSMSCCSKFRFMFALNHSGPIGLGHKTSLMCCDICIGNACIFSGHVHSLKGTKTLFPQAYIHHVDDTLKLTFVFEFWRITQRHISQFFSGATVWNSVTRLLWRKAVRIGWGCGTLSVMLFRPYYSQRLQVWAGTRTLSPACLAVLHVSSFISSSFYKSCIKMDVTKLSRVLNM